MITRKCILGFIGLFLCLGMNIYAQSSARVNFGNYPADYQIAYLDLGAGGYSRAITVRNLFGPNAPFTITFLEQLPATVILESGIGSRDEFTGTLLLSAENQNTGENVRIMRMQVKFQSDNIAERSYVRYIKFANLVSGQVVELESYGNPYQDGETAGFFTEAIKYFWDVSKLENDE